jgi:DNA polymerase elongation subunit (family B)
MCIDEALKALKADVSSNKKLISVSLDIVKKVFEPYFEKMLLHYVSDIGVNHKINFKHEKIIKKQIILKTKRYVCEYIYKEGVTFQKPKFDFVGVEVVRSSTPSFCRERLRTLIEDLISNMNKPKIMSEITKSRIDFEKSPIPSIAAAEGIRIPIPNCRIGAHQKGCPIHVKAAIAYNYLLKELSIPMQQVISGSKIKYVYTRPDNKYNAEVVGFLNVWPEEFNQYFKIDYKKQFETKFLSLLEDFFLVLGWGKIDLNAPDHEDLVKW